MDKRIVMQKLGSMQQVASVRPFTYAEGRAKGLDAYEVKNGPLRFTALAGKCLDIGEFSYKGINCSFLAKQGLVGRPDFDTLGEEGPRSIMGGLLFTCGLENVGLACTQDGKGYPQHGRVRSTPAEHLCADAAWEGGDYCLTVKGEMREAELFGKNLVLRRTIRTRCGEAGFEIVDEIENESPTPEVLLLLYHINLGYPLLDTGAEVVVPTRGAVPRDAAAEKDAHLWNKMEDPIDREPERVYLHDLAANREGNTFAALYNPALGLGIKISYNKTALPRLIQWKTTASGDYAMGLEPANANVFGRTAEEDPHTLAPFAKETIRLRIDMVEGDDAFAALQEEAKRLLQG